VKLSQLSVPLSDGKAFEATIKTGVWTWVNYVAYGLRLSSFHIYKADCEVTDVLDFFLINLNEM